MISSVSSLVKFTKTSAKPISHDMADGTWTSQWCAFMKAVRVVWSSRRAFSANAIVPYEILPSFCWCKACVFLTNGCWYFFRQLSPYYRLPGQSGFWKRFLPHFTGEKYVLWGSPYFGGHWAHVRGSMGYLEELVYLYWRPPSTPLHFNV